MDVMPPAPQPKYRRFTLIDLVGLIAASGPGLFFWRTYAYDNAWDGQLKLVPTSVREWIYFGSGCAVSFSGWVTIREMARPKPRPATFGMVACLAVLLATVLVFPGKFAQVLAIDTPWWDRSWLIHHALLRYIDATWNLAAICNSVMLGWIILWRLGGWQRSTGSLDRLGCGVGIYFLLAYAIDAALNVFEMIADLPSSPSTGGS